MSSSPAGGDGGTERGSRRAAVTMALALAVCAAACASNPAPPPAPSLPASTPASPAPSATAAPSATLIPAAAPSTLTPAPTVTPAPALRQLTAGGCCVQPFWSPDGSQVWFIDRPRQQDPAGIWGMDALGGEPRLITERVDIYSSDMSLAVFLEAGRTMIERLSTGERWVAQPQGRAISISPDSQWIAWQVPLSDANFDRRQVEIWVAGLDGSAARRLAVLSGGGLSGWFPDSARLLVSLRDAGSGRASVAALRLDDGSPVPIASGSRLRGAALSPDGEWAAYMVTFSGDPEQDGLWLARTDGSGTLRLEVFGAYRWRSEGQLLVIPLITGGSHQLVQVEAASGEMRALTDPAVTPFRVAGGDWAVSPDGRRVVFVSAEDRNVWLIELP